MAYFSWLKKLAGVLGSRGRRGGARRGGVRRPRKQRPRVEALEDRIVPSDVPIFHSLNLGAKWTLLLDFDGYNHGSRYWCGENKSNVETPPFSLNSDENN